MGLVMYVFEVEGSEYDRILPIVNKCRGINSNIIESILSTFPEPFDYNEYDQTEMLGWEKGWRVEDESKFPPESLGEVSGVEVVDSILYYNNDHEENICEMIVTYFNDNPKYRHEIEGKNFVLESDEMDFYQFVGFTREQVEECAEEIAKFWNLTDLYESEDILM